ncbi:unnamed protein product, partial [Effrenium voratum]
VSALKHALPSARVVALGGATETTVWSNSFHVSSIDPCWRSVPYGRPIWNHQYYVLDESASSESPALPGMAGQLHIAGTGVALGYIGQPDLTAERFHQSSLAGQTVYRTGDLVRFMPEEPWGHLRDGLLGSELQLEFLGRADFQVKVRGHRVELGEIEEAARQALLPVPVQQVAVLATGSVERRLVAFVTPEQVDVAQLRQVLKERLPGYMIPEVVVPRPELPLTTSGKINRQALERSLDHTVDRPLRQPQNEAERSVLAAFQEVLGMAPLSTDDDFFELGGQSLAAMRLQGRLPWLALEDIFELRTASRMALRLESGASPVGAPQPGPPGCEAPASFEQERFWVMEQMGSSHGIPFAYRIRGSDSERLCQALRDVVLRHEPLRTVLREDSEGRLMQHVLPEPDLDGLLGCMLAF